MTESNINHLHGREKNGSVMASVNPERFLKSCLFGDLNVTIKHDFISSYTVCVSLSNLIYVVQIVNLVGPK